MQKRYILDNDGTNIFAHSEPLNDEGIDRAVVANLPNFKK